MSRPINAILGTLTALAVGTVTYFATQYVLRDYCHKKNAHISVAKADTRSKPNIFTTVWNNVFHAGENITAAKAELNAKIDREEQDNTNAIAGLKTGFDGLHKITDDQASEIGTLVRENAQRQVGAAPSTNATITPVVSSVAVPSSSTKEAIVNLFVTTPVPPKVVEAVDIYLRNCMDGKLEKENKTYERIIKRNDLEGVITADMMKNDPRIKYPVGALDAAKHMSAAWSMLRQTGGNVAHLASLGNYENSFHELHNIQGRAQMRYFGEGIKLSINNIEHSTAYLGSLGTNYVLGPASPRAVAPQAPAHAGQAQATPPAPAAPKPPAIEPLD